MSRSRDQSKFTQETFELGVILLRKKLYTQAVKNLEKARKTWDGEPDELAQVCVLMSSLLFSPNLCKLLKAAFIEYWASEGTARHMKPTLVMVYDPMDLLVSDTILSFACSKACGLARTGLWCRHTPQ